MSEENKVVPQKLMTFIKRPPNVTPIEECMLYTKNILISRIFLGSYLERRYAPSLSEYRDVIVISREETELNKDLKTITQKWERFSNIKWTGISVFKENTEEETYCFWVELSNLTFDNYWFQIKNIKLLNNELNLRIKCIRKVSFVVQSALLKVSTKNEISSSDDSPFNPYDIQVHVNNYWNEIQRNIKNFYVIVQPNLTWKNLFSAIRLFIATLILCISGLFFCFKNSANFLLQFIHEITILIEAITPIIIQLIDFFSKIVGGFYILLAGIFKQNPRHRQADIYFNALPTIPSLNTDWKERNRILRQELLFQNKNRPMPSTKSQNQAH